MSYYFNIDSQRVGSLNSKEVEEKIGQGGISSETLAWKEGMKD